MHWVFLVYWLWSPDLSTSEHRDKEVTTMLALCMLTPPTIQCCKMQNWIVRKTSASNNFCPICVGKRAVVWGIYMCCSSSHQYIFVIRIIADDNW